MIRLHNVTKSYDKGAVVAVRDVSFRVEGGEILVLLGESGCGKTTTLKMVNRLIEPTSGRIEVDGRDIAHVDQVVLRRGIGYVFQGIGLLPHLTIGQNIGLVPSLLKWDRQRIDRRINELLTLVNLSEDYRTRYPRELSGGQRQRVGVARALAGRPRIMLMDEPFGALDPITRDSLRIEYARLHRQLSLTTVMVTHDMTEALLIADRIVVMHQGAIIETGTPHQLLTAAADKRVAAMMQAPRRQADQLEQLIAAAD